MIYTALSSSSHTGSTIQKVLETAVGAGVKGIEWANGSHIPDNDLSVASDTMIATLRASLTTVSYAASYECGKDDRQAFCRSLATARELNAPILSLGPPPSMACLDFGAYIDEARYMGDEAARLGITLCLGVADCPSLDSSQVAASLLSAIDHPFVRLSWEWPEDAGFDQAMESFSSVSGLVCLLYIKAGSLGGPECDKSEEWLQYLDAYDEQGGNPDMARYAVIRTVDSQSGLTSDARLIDEWSTTLRRYRRRRVY